MYSLGGIRNSACCILQQLVAVTGPNNNTDGLDGNTNAYHQSAIADCTLWFFHLQLPRPVLTQIEDTSNWHVKDDIN